MMKVQNSINKFCNSIIWFQIYYNIFVKYFIHNFNLPSSFNYISDIITISLFILVLIRKVNTRTTIPRPQLYLLLIIFAFFGCGFISIIFNTSNFLLYLWAIRNYGRFFIWFFCVAEVFEVSEIPSHISRMEKLLYVNFILMLYQYIFIGDRTDYLNGFFGRYTGGNSALNTFLIILTVENICSLIVKKKKKSLVLCNILIICTTCAMNEIKFYYIELVFIAVFIAILQLKPTKKTLFRFINICFGFFILAFIGGCIFLQFYPDFKRNLNVDYMVYYLSRSYNSSGIIYHEGIPVVNRLSAYPIIDHFFLTGNIKNLLGIGLGYSDYSKFIFSPFYEKFGPVGYGNFLLPQIYLEVGLIGLSIYLIFYIVTFLISKKNMKNKAILYESMIASVLSIWGIIINMYNAVLKIESSGYIYFTFLALSIAVLKKNKYKNNCFNLTDKNC